MDIFLISSLVGVIALAVGIFIGDRAANEAWKARAGGYGYGLTPHHHNGRFYYVIPEDEFRRDYELKRDQLAWDDQEGE